MEDERAQTILSFIINARSSPQNFDHETLLCRLLLVSSSVVNVDASTHLPVQIIIDCRRIPSVSPKICFAPCNFQEHTRTRTATPPRTRMRSWQ